MAHDSDRLVRLTDLHDEVEARAVADQLSSEEIQHVIKPHGVAFYPGVRTGRGVWGVAWVRSDQLARAAPLLAELKAANVDVADLEQQALDAAPVPHSITRRTPLGTSSVVIMSLVGLVLWLLLRS